MSAALAALLAVGLSAGCSGSGQGGLLTSGDAFVAITHDATAAVEPRKMDLVTTLAEQGHPAEVTAPTADQDFYLAIRKDQLGKKWFLSAYLKQYFPGAVSYGAARTLGTRVVSFAAQNGQLVVFDVGDGKQNSQTFDPQVLLESYPIVAGYGPFETLPGSSDYILFDPAAGLNRFGVVADAFAGGMQPDRFSVELAFLQRFRKIADGVTYEEVFTGYAEHADPMAPKLGEPNQFRGSGTLGIGLRQYKESDGYAAMNLPMQKFYFGSEPHMVPDTGMTQQFAVKWNIHPGMTPIRWLISPQIQEIANEPRFAPYDVIGAFKRGIENWNAVFGFPVLEAELAQPDDSFADDDKNYLIFDKDPSLGYAFADWRTNPNTGEIRGASVYINFQWLDYAESTFKDDAPPAEASGGPMQRKPRPAVASLIWEPLAGNPLCVLWAPPYRDRADDGHAAATAPPSPATNPQPLLTKKDKLEHYITHVLVHEIGHTLGLRHNFKGSLAPPSVSVMDYLLDEDSIARDKPGPYDVDAIHYLYEGAKQMPMQAFCTDEDQQTDPNCTQFDQGPDPLDQYFADRYRQVSGDYLSGKSTTLPDRSLNNVLKYVRAGSASDIRQAAWELAVESVKLGAEPSFLPAMIAPGTVDNLARHVFSRLYLDPDTDRGVITADPPADDSPLLQSIVDQLQRNLTNADHIRSFETRRVCVDVLKKMQNLTAYNALLAAQQLIQSTRSQLTGADGAQTDDLLSRIAHAVSPYFN